MISTLPSKHLNYIFEFLDVSDCSSILLVCKKFYSIINDHNKFWTRECFRQYITFDLELYSEIYDNEEYKTSIKQRSFALPNGQWRKLLAEGIKHRKSLRAVLKQITLRDKADAFLMNFDEILKQPPLPMSTLKRENIMCNTHTLFQEKLSDVLYEEGPNLTSGRIFSDQYKAIIDELKHMENELFQQAAFSSKEEILKARWYLFEMRDNESEGTFCSDDQTDFIPELPELSKLQKISNSNTEDTSSFKGKNCLLMRLYDCLYNVLSHFCAVISDYLDTVGNVYDLLSEYTARWNAYVCTTLELERLLHTFTELMNQNYELTFEGYPSYPKFSIWRMMTKIWLKEVFEKSNFKLILNESFLRVLSNHREKNIKQALNNNFVNINLADKYIELPKKLYVGLNINKKKNSSIKYQSYDKLNNTPHVCFSDVMDLESRLICSFIQSILDISLNEVNVHYLNCSDITTNYPYRELEECFLMKSRDYYNDYQHLFHESPDYFYQFLKSDISLLSKLLNERTNVKLETIQLQNGVQFMKNFVNQRLHKTPLQEFEKVLKHVIPLEENGTDVYDLIENAIQQAIDEASREEEKALSFYQLPALDLEDDLDCANDNKALVKLCIQQKTNKSFMNKLVSFFVSASPEFITNFTYLKNKLELLANVKANDTYIKESNVSKNIPYEVGDVDKLFYDLDKDIDLKLLDKLYEDYQAFTKQQETEINEKKRLEFNGSQENGIHNFTNLQDGGGLFDFDEEIDLMNLPDLSIRRAQF